MSRTKQRSAAGLRPPLPLAGFGVLLLLSLSLRCASKSSDTNADAGRGGGIAASGGTGALGQGGTAAQQGGSDTGGQAVAGAGSSRAGGAGVGGASGSSSGHGGSGAIGGAPACTADTAAKDCPLPASTCASDGRTLEYYSASCPAGQCVYTADPFTCPDRCVGGACLSSTTTTGGSPPPQTCTPSNDGTAGQAGDGPYTAGDCPIPPSTCADADTLDYYVVQCVKGQCITSVQSLHCAAGCVNDACQGNFTR